jgi:hypothetical protein
MYAQKADWVDNFATWTEKNHALAASLLLGTVLAALVIASITRCDTAQLASDEKEYAAYLKIQSGHVLSVCRPGPESQCSCSRVYLPSHWVHNSVQLVSARAEIALNGDVVCKVP